MWFWIVLLVLLVPLVYVRLAPTDVAQVHQPVKGDVDTDGEGHALRVIPATSGTLAQLDGALQALPRTSVVAGKVAEGRITYVTRSKWIGFPDFTTIEETDGHIRLFARLRFGKSDFGVNKARLEHVLRRAAS